MKNVTIDKFISFNFLIGLLAALCLIIAFILFFVFERFREEQITEAKLITKVMHSEIIPPLLFDYRESASQGIATFGNLNQVRRIVVFNSQDEVFVSYPEEGPDESTFDGDPGLWSGFYRHESLIRHEGEVVGRSIIHLDATKHLDLLLDTLAYLGGVVLLLVFILFWLARLLSRKVSRPFSRLLRYVEDVATQKNYQYEEVPESKSYYLKELQTFSVRFISLIDEIRKRDADLNRINADLEKLVEEKSKSLKQAQEKLVEEAHKAGMAEVASGTVHNIGNVLTSINTDLSLYRESTQFEEFITKGLMVSKEFQKSLDRDHENLERLKLISEFYVTFFENFGDAEQQANQTLNRLVSNVNVCLDIIHFQQTLASHQGYFEDVSVKQLIDIFLSIKETYIKNRKIQLNLELKDNDLVRVQKSKVINVLINLLNNAYESLSEKHIEPKIITLSGQSMAEFYTLEFCDNGEPIAAEVVNKLFTSGFTTKTHGHGFGLHSCYNYMKEIGGDIFFKQAKEGPTFVIQIPLSQSLPLQSSLAK